jgi:hypothetical protein
LLNKDSLAIVQMRSFNYIDYAGPFLGKMFLIMVDAFSKWLEVHPMNVATSRAAIEKRRSTFAIHGLPTTIVRNSACEKRHCSEFIVEFIVKR